MTPPSPDNSHTPSEIFASWLARQDQGDAREFDRLLRDNAAHAADLKRVHADWMRGQAALDIPLTKRLQLRFGENVDPEVSLRGSDERAESLSSDVLQRLSGRSSSFGRYQLKGEIARGGMGAIVKVWDEDLRRHLAMKVILGQADAPPSIGTPPVEPAKVARFLEEAQVTGQLDHPGIVPVHELGLDPDGRVYFTMKLVKGVTLKRIFDLVAENKDGWTQTKALGVLLKVCEAMAYAHDKGVIHRDLKPGNIMVGKFGEVHVMDWGLARILDKKDEKDIRIREEVKAISSSLRTEREEHRGETPESPLYTMDGDVVGTPAYMPPEQAAGKVDEIGPHSDVYAMGAMLYHLIAGHMPYVPKDARLNNYAVWSRVQEGPPPSITQISPRTPAELVAICDKAMARDWTQRYRDMSELAEDLSAYLERRVVRAYETGTWAETKKWVQRNKPLAASLGIIAALLISGIIASLLLQAKADRQAVIANQNRARSGMLEMLATQRADDVLSLSAIQELKELEEEADHLWPALPDMSARYADWIARADILVHGRTQDEGPTRRAHPSLKDHEAKLAEIRKRSTLGRGAEHLLWIRRMLGEESWPDSTQLSAHFDRLKLQSLNLNEEAWRIVNPDPAAIVYGGEVRALVMAQHAVATAESKDLADCRDTLAWALFRTGQLDAAREEGRRACAESRNQNLAQPRLAALERAIWTWTGESARQAQAEEASKLAGLVADLTRAAEERGTYEFDDAQDRWWHAQLSQLVADLKAFTAEKTGLLSEGISEQHGWGIVKRRKEAATIEERSVSGPDAKRRWGEAITAIAQSAKYARLKLTPQLGLLPIGEDPESHLWEFAHLESGEPAKRSPDGKLILKEEMWLVLVLIPAGTFWMGAQSQDPRGHNYDAHANAYESPVRELAVQAFFISKYEMTQGQWQRLTGHNPSVYAPGTGFVERTMTLLDPVEQVSWTESTALLSRHGLVLPSEIQWEYAARAGTESPWWTGVDVHSLAGATNLADSYCKRHGGTSSWMYEEWLDDGFDVHAPIGRFRANAFGLHDVIGNVWEWCRDPWGESTQSARDQDLARVNLGGTNRVNRGGGFYDSAANARSASRFSDSPERRSDNLGLRPARAITP